MVWKSFCGVWFAFRSVVGCDTITVLYESADLYNLAVFGHEAVIWFPNLLCSVRNVYKPCHEFISDILHAPYRAATDVYALMFLTDVVDFIIIVFGFWAFGVSTVYMTAMKFTLCTRPLLTHNLFLYLRRQRALKPFKPLKTVPILYYSLLRHHLHVIPIKTPSLEALCLVTGHYNSVLWT